MVAAFTREQRTALEAALRGRHELPACPACGGSLSRQDVVPPENVPYVRHRVWLMCATCKRSVSLDLR